jgi:hypothetical protein
MLNIIPLLAAACLVFPWPQVAFADIEVPHYIQQQLPSASLVGEGRLRVMVWDIYEARLWSKAGVYKAGAPFILELDYLRAIKGREIADTSAEEIRRQGLKDEIKIAAWHRQLRRIIPNVDRGVTLSGFANAKGDTVFFRDGVEIGRIEDPDFTKYFFSIWLSPRTSQPRLRAQLIGQKP